jgi:selenocysteine lyase/cysteine desulfurase
LQDLAEARPDTFLRYTYPDLLEKSRSTIAPILGVSTNEVVFVPNATTGVNTVLRNLVYQKGDVILHFSTVYGACEKTIDCLCETAQVERVCIAISYPAEDEDIVAKFNSVARNLQNEGRKIRVAMFDTVLTFPGVRFPWEALVEACKNLQILSLIDGAHGIGHIDLTNMGRVDPDFFTSNCYKYESCMKYPSSLIPCSDGSLCPVAVPYYMYRSVTSISYAPRCPLLGDFNRSYKENLL